METNIVDPSGAATGGNTRLHAPPDIAAGPTLSALVAVNKAYAATDACSLLRRMLRTAQWPSRMAVAGSILATLVAFWRNHEFGIQVSAFMTVASFYWFKRDAFRDYYAHKRTATFLDTFGSREQAVRYILFKETLPAAIVCDGALLERVLRLLEQRQRVRQAGLVTRHPVVAALVAFFLMLVGALVKKVADASFTGAFTTAFLVGMLILFAMQLGTVWRSRAYRDEELTEFVLWLWAEASEIGAGHAGDAGRYL